MSLDVAAVQALAGTLGTFANIGVNEIGGDLVLLGEVKGRECYQLRITLDVQKLEDAQRSGKLSHALRSLVAHLETLLADSLMRMVQDGANEEKSAA